METQTDKITITIKPKIQWDCRYSKTMENDKQGRWARVAFAGAFNNWGFVRGKVCRWEIAWIKKFQFENEPLKLKFRIEYNFPSNGEKVCDTLPEAKKEVIKSFNWFIKMCLKENGIKLK